LNFSQPTYSVKESTEEQKRAGERIAELASLSKEAISSTVSYKDRQVDKVTTYKGSEVTDIWHAQGSSS
jgi:hypothetical protein